MKIPEKLTRVRLDKLNFREYSVRIESAIEIKKCPGLDLTSAKNKSEPRSVRKICLCSLQKAGHTGGLSMTDMMMPYEMERQRLYQKEQEEMRRDMREIEKTRVKAEITENIRTQAQEVRRQNKEYSDEKKRGQYETVEFTAGGEVRVITKNLSVPTIPREITNLTNLHGKIFRRRSFPQESVFCLEGNIGGQKIRVYFKGDEVGNGTYVLKRLSAQGISIWANPVKAKRYAVQMLEMLILDAPVYQIADLPGWIKTGEEGFSFVEENCITWEYLMEVVK